jgi:hypothetical protein
VQRKIPGKKFVQPLRQRKKFVQANSKVQIVLKKNKWLNALKKILQRQETEKKIPGISNGPPLSAYCGYYEYL